MSDPFQDVDSAGIEFAEATAKTMEIRQSEPVMEKIVNDDVLSFEVVLLFSWRRILLKYILLLGNRNVCEMRARATTMFMMIDDGVEILILLKMSMRSKDGDEYYISSD